MKFISRIIAMVVSSILALSILSNCSSDPPKPKCVGDECPIKDPPEGDTLCENLKGNIDNIDTTLSVAKNYINNEICATDGEMLAQLRNSPYSGIGTPKVHQLDAMEDGDETYSKVAGTMYTPLTPKQHFEMLHMQTTEPDKFEEEGYETDPELTVYEEGTIKKSSKGNEYVSYEYKKDKVVSGETSTFHYFGQTYFVEIKEDETYVVINRLDEKKNKEEGTGTSKLNGIIVIHKNESSSETEVLAISEQKSYNSGNHKTALESSKESLQEDTRRAYKNAKNYN